ncbi:hypothetical protein BDF22DRAFT_664611 [Syncephalis plumigaleata]|nr:hypothetical protein BDF22DRAFT_664611 [Syncephalis plumigaleata]
MKLSKLSACIFFAVVMTALTVVDAKPRIIRRASVKNKLNARGTQDSYLPHDIYQTSGISDVCSSKASMVKTSSKPDIKTLFRRNVNAASKKIAKRFVRRAIPEIPAAPGTPSSSSVTSGIKRPHKHHHEHHHRPGKPGRPSRPGRPAIPGTPSSSSVTSGIKRPHKHHHEHHHKPGKPHRPGKPA